MTGAIEPRSGKASFKDTIKGICALLAGLAGAMAYLWIGVEWSRMSNHDHFDLGWLVVSVLVLEAVIGKLYNPGHRWLPKGILSRRFLVIGISGLALSTGCQWLFQSLAVHGSRATAIAFAMLTTGLIAYVAIWTLQLNYARPAGARLQAGPRLARMLRLWRVLIWSFGAVLVATCIAGALVKFINASPEHLPPNPNDLRSWALHLSIAAFCFAFFGAGLPFGSAMLATRRVPPQRAPGT